jgi:hypothetical protein
MAPPSLKWLNQRIWTYLGGWPENAYDNIKKGPLDGITGEALDDLMLELLENKNP